jgi:pimeloyl-ACP methyl ester carboxylesterase
MAEALANGLRFHTQTMRSPHGVGQHRPKVVMVHGLSVDLSSFYVTIASSVAVESDVHLYDLRGHGRSEVPRYHYAVNDHIRDLAALVDAWEIDRPMHLFGNSYGGIVALVFAHLYPERVASLFLIEPHLSAPGWGKKMADDIRDFGGDPAETERWIGNDPMRRRWLQRNETMLRKTSILDDLTTEVDIPLSWLQGLRCPVFSMYGSDSDVVDRAAARDRHIPGCEPIIVPGTHMLLAEAPVVIRDHAVEWIRQQNSSLTGTNV